MLGIRRAVPTESIAEVSICIVWCVMLAHDDGISRQRMVTVCPLQNNMSELTHILMLLMYINLLQTERKQIHIPFLLHLLIVAGTLCQLYAYT